MSIGCNLTYYLLSIPYLTNFIGLFAPFVLWTRHKICKSRLPNKKFDLENDKFLSSFSPSSTIAREIPFDWNKLTLLMENFVKHEYYGPHTIYLSLPCVALNKTSSTDTHSISHNHTNTLSLTTTNRRSISHYHTHIYKWAIQTTHAQRHTHAQCTYAYTHTHILIYMLKAGIYQ